MYFWYLTQCEPIVHISPIAATHRSDPLFTTAEILAIDYPGQPVNASNKQSTHASSGTGRAHQM